MENEHLQQVKRWIEIAEEDYRLAQHTFQMESNVPYRLIGYHAQQSAEKYLKAYLVSKLIDFPYTHSIEHLVSLIESNNNISGMFPEAYELTNYAISRRYPGDYGSVSYEEAKKAMKLAEC